MCEGMRPSDISRLENDSFSSSDRDRDLLKRAKREDLWVCINVYESTAHPAVAFYDKTHSQIPARLTTDRQTRPDCKNGTASMEGGTAK